MNILELFMKGGSIKILDVAVAGENPWILEGYVPNCGVCVGCRLGPRVGLKNPTAAKMYTDGFCTRHRLRT